MEAQSDQNNQEWSQISAQAARWYARVRAPDCNAAERAAFQKWLAASASHARAYDRAEQAAEHVTRGIQTDARLRALAAAALEQPADESCVPQRRWQMAAALALSIGLGLFAASHFNARTVANTAHFANAGQREQRIPLEDGSVVHLDVDSEINVQMSKAERRIELKAGRAYFEVAHDSTRPLSVSAGGTRTVALGTHFQVMLAAHTVGVTLAEGSVAISDTTENSNWREVLKPGEQLKYSAETGTREKQSVDATAVTSWSQGRLVFKATPLKEALEEVNRYAAVKIRLGDQRLAAIPIGGNFAAGCDSQQVVDALNVLLPLRAVRVGASEIVLFQRYETDTP